MFRKLVRRLLENWRHSPARPQMPRIEPMEQRCLLSAAPLYDSLTNASIAAMQTQMSDKEIVASTGFELWPGSYFVYKTSAGRFGKAAVSAWDTDTNQVTLSWMTFNPDGTVYSSGSSLTLNHGQGADLDAGTVTNTGTDIRWYDGSSYDPVNNTLVKLLVRGAGPEIGVYGNYLSIADGGTPSAANYTDFGTVPMPGGSMTRSFSILNLGVQPLSLTGYPRVSITGLTPESFTVIEQPNTDTIAPGQQALFTIRFAPETPGFHSAKINIFNNDGNNGDGVESTYSFTISGIGQPPPATAKATIKTIIRKNTKPLRFAVTYTSDGLIDTSSIDSNDIIVSGPRKFRQIARLVSKPTANAGTVTAVYSISAPGAVWNKLANGTYTISLRLKQVKDTSGTFALSTPITRFVVNVKAA